MYDTEIGFIIKEILRYYDKDVEKSSKWNQLESQLNRKWISLNHSSQTTNSHECYLYVACYLFWHDITRQHYYYNYK